MDKSKVLQELQFKAIRSGGPGGQHANKVSSKVVLVFDLAHSTGLSDAEKIRLATKLANRLNKDGTWALQCDRHRSQHQNKEEVIKRFFVLLKQALRVPKKRKASAPSRSAMEKRLRAKKRNAQKKADRARPEH
ncbi:alternative ribosome rescue aminoacyl-tRNA hydrolase ArfB [Maribacter sp. 2307ULW6-5]|uniref:alternative ribosome rescue aminoacyl-tRNA hydrolase ArfB n=1 Tax=Maribacter sp. 2307ULW6-5 TaxID=3386275 RepID=UPI0039BC466D